MTQQPEPFDASHSTEWSDERIARMLTWYFAREMPESVRAAEPERPLCQPLSARQSPGVVRPVSRWLVPLCLATLIGSGWILQHSPPQAAAHGAARLITLETTSLPVSTQQVSFIGDHDQFQQRSELRWTSVSSFEPATGAWVEWSAPELVIDIETVANSIIDVQP